MRLWLMRDPGLMGERGGGIAVSLIGACKICEIGREEDDPVADCGGGVGSDFGGICTEDSA